MIIALILSEFIRINLLSTRSLVHGDLYLELWPYCGGQRDQLYIDKIHKAYSTKIVLQASVISNILSSVSAAPSCIRVRTAIVLAVIVAWCIVSIVIAVVLRISIAIVLRIIAYIIVSKSCRYHSSYGQGRHDEYTFCKFHSKHLLVSIFILYYNMSIKM